MPTTDEQLHQWLEAPEGSRFEFKAARQNYHFEKLVDYCGALANEGGGKVIFGVTDRRPRRIVGTEAFAAPGRTEAGLYDRLHHRIPVEELRSGSPPECSKSPRLSQRGSVFVRQYPRRIEIVSPGGFPLGITPENILWQQNPRNRRIAEVLSKCGLVERAGQGFDLIFRECIRQSKPLPDFSRTDSHFVWLPLHGEIQDPDFLRFLEEVGEERMATFSTEDFLVVDLVYREEPVPDHLKSRVGYLLEQEVIERLGHGRGIRLFLSRRFHRYLGKAGVYTRKLGLDRETNKALLVKHIADSGPEGAPFAEFAQVLPALSRRQIQRLMQGLKLEGLIALQGSRKGARWVSV